MLEREKDTSLFGDMAAKRPSEGRSSPDIVAARAARHESANGEMQMNDGHLSPTEHDITLPTDDISGIPDEHGSSIRGAVFNFTNCIIGAGAIGLGGAIASSGGLVSVLTILFFGFLTKVSLDMVVQLSVETGAHNSYEELGRIALGTFGWASVLVSKSLYSFGCLIAYIVVVKDNFGTALLHFLFGDATNTSWLARLLVHSDAVTLLLSTFIILPLCLLRDMSSLSQLSLVSVLSMCFIVVIVVKLYIDNPNGRIREEGGTLYENWFEVRSGYLQSLGTFVFTFVSQHTVHLTYESMRSDLRTVQNWKRVSAFSILIATCVSLTVGVAVYITFWQHAQSDLFDLYPPLRSIDLAKMLLCTSMLLTFPLPFFTCRDMAILFLTHSRRDETTLLPANETGDEDANASLRHPLLDNEEALIQASGCPSDPLEERGSNRVSRRLLVDGQDRQLKLPYHIAVTVSLWALTTLLAILAPSLGDVLDLVGCATGTVIAFILPALFSFRLRGYSHLTMFILVVGLIVGSVGTALSVQKILADMP